ncbi:MAG: tripartite tricarboxylate transporter substrate-binding protein [Alphaproteobacteria bacterium]
MGLPRRNVLKLATAAVALPALPRAAFAQAAYPSKPITIVVPYAAGGPTDTIARILAERLRVSLGQTLIIENTTGAGGTIGVGRVVRAAPDGYTIGIGQNGSHVVTGATYQRLPYDLLNDLQPLTLLTDAPFFLAARKTFPADDLKGLIAWMKANPGQIIFANGGNGSITHISGLLFMDLTGTTGQVVPYRGNAPAMQDVVAGQVDIMIADPVTGVPQARGGSIKAYAVTANKRLSTAPEIPTVDEAGLPGYYVSLWHGLWMPKGTPQPIMDKLNAAVAEALADPTVQGKLASIGQDIFSADRQTPQGLDAHQRAEIAKWWPLIKAAEIKVE